MKTHILAAASIALLAASPAQVEDVDFTLCDGYAPPSDAEGDSMFSFWGYALVDSRLKKGDNPAESAILSCDRALGDSRLQGRLPFRNATLLQARAFHQLAAGRDMDALESLDRADAAAKGLNDEAFTEEFSLTGYALRAYAEYRTGRSVAAREHLAAMERVRPYSAAIMELTGNIRLQLEDSQEQLRKGILLRAPADPSVLHQVFWLSMFYGDFAEAVRLGPQVTYEMPRIGGTANIVGIEDRDYELIEIHADLAGAMAYALAATGESEASHATLQKARRDMIDALQLLVSTRLERRAGADRERVRQTGEAAEAKLDQWAAAIELRGRASTLTFDALAGTVSDQNLGSLPIIVDLIGQLRPASSSDERAIRRALAELEIPTTRMRRALGKMSFDEMREMLPRPWKKRSSLQLREKGGLFATARNGFYAKQERGTPYINVRYGNQVAFSNEIRDMSLLAAAANARKTGKDSFIIISRISVTHTIHVSKYYGAVRYTQHDGEEIRMRILPVNAAELPPAMESIRWRLIHVSDVEAALNRLYPVRPKR